MKHIKLFEGYFTTEYDRVLKELKTEFNKLVKEIFTIFEDEFNHTSFFIKRKLR